MTGPFVRLLGDKGLASRYIRNAEQLLGKVHSVRGAAGVPVFALRRSMIRSGVAVFIQAASFGLIDVITIHAEPELSVGKVLTPPTRLASGVVFEHYRSGMAVPQGVVARNGVAADEELTRFVKFNTAWRGPGKASAGMLGLGGAPQYIDERDMFPMHAHSYNPSLDVHVVVKTYRRGSWEPARASEIFIGGVSVLMDEEGCNFVGARLYDDALMIAYLDPSREKLHVSSIPLFSLSYQKPFLYSEIVPELTPTVNLPFEAEHWQTVFDFHPTNRGLGVYLAGWTDRVNLSPTGVEGRLYYSLGEYRYDPDDIEGSIQQTETGDSLVYSTRTPRYGETASTSWTNAYSTTDDYLPLDHPQHVSVSQWWYPEDGAGVSASLQIEVPGTTYTVGPFSPMWMDDQWRSFYPNPTGLTLIEAETASASVGWTLGDPAVPPPMRSVTTTRIMTGSGGGTIDRTFSHSLTINEVPVWAGFNSAGERIICRIDGTLLEAITTPNTFNHSYTYTAVGESQETVTGSQFLASGTTLGGEYWEMWEWFTKHNYSSKITEASADIDTTFETRVLEHNLRWKRYIDRMEDDAIDPRIEDLVLLEASMQLMADDNPVVTKPHVRAFYNGLCGGRHVVAYSRRGASSSLPPNAQIIPRIEDSYGAVGGEVTDGELPQLHDVFWFGHHFRQTFDITSGLRIVNDRGVEVYKSDEWDAPAQLSRRLAPDYFYRVKSHFSENGTFNHTTSVAVTSFLDAGEGFISNRLDRGCIYDAPLDMHVVSPYTIGTAYDFSLDMSGPRRVSTAGTKLTDISDQLNAAVAPEPPPEMPGLQPIEIETVISESDHVPPRALF